MVLSRKDRQAMWDRCAHYIARTRSLPEAQKLAKKEGFTANTSTWIGAMGKIMELGAELKKKKL